MRTEYFITLDTHCRTSDACVKTRAGKLVRREHLPTTIPALTEFIRSVPRPRQICFEEGPLAGWLYRSLRQEADRVVVCDPRRNAYVGKDGDKDDPIDAEKLNDLFRANLIRQVHQNDCATRAAFKQIVGAYHAAVGSRVAQANRLIGLGKRWGLLWNSSLILSPDAQSKLDKSAAGAAVPQPVRLLVGHLLKDVQQAHRTEQELGSCLKKIAAGDPLIGRLTGIPGYGAIRAATLVAYLDTPWRFKSREALWKYCGLGLRREKSGDGQLYLRVEQQCSRVLRHVTIGAAQKVLQQIALRNKTPESERKNDEAIQSLSHKYHAWLANGITPRNARRNLARALLNCAWAMWKSQQPFNPAWINRKTQG